MDEKKKIILGIDPGTVIMGYGLITVQSKAMSLLEMGVLHLSKFEDHAERLEMIFKKMESLIKIYRPDSVAIEAPFFGKNVQSMLKLGRAQGVAIAAAMMHGLKAVEYAPRKVKQSVTGRGNSTKEQVWEILKYTLKITENDLRYMDAADAVAVALCHHYQNSDINSIITKDTAVKGKKLSSTNWKTFISQNPERIK